MKGNGMKAKQKLSDKARVGATLTLGLWRDNPIGAVVSHG
jgi:hypothetical protein